VHELSLAGGVLQLVEESARRERFSRVISLHLEAGQLSGVDVDALRFALDGLAPGTVLEGAQWVIDQPPGQAWCMPCGDTVELRERGRPCPRCGSFQLQPTGGMELRVLDLQVGDN
jgi:hydrogenase nickel incorporation protein HypA/HybF